MIQTQRLGIYLAERYNFTHFYSSDLRRAYITAKAIEDAQKKKTPTGPLVTVVPLELLREQDFGSFECVPWSSKRSNLTTHKLLKPEDVGFRPKETTEAMNKRADVFLNDYIVPQLVVESEDESTVAVVSHGLILAVLWKATLKRFGPGTVALSPEVGSKSGGRPLEYLPGWSNTGYLELDIVTAPAPADSEANVTEKALQPNTEGFTLLPGWKMVVRSVNNKQHLNNLRRTRGVGSSTHDARQKSLEGFFKKPKLVASGEDEDFSLMQPKISKTLTEATSTQDPVDVSTEEVSRRVS